MKTLLLCILGTLLPMAFQGQSVAITAEQIHLDDQGIFAYVEGQWLPISAIHYDNTGRYLAVIRTRWICPACLYNNSEHADTCQREYPDTGRKCEYPRPARRR